MPVISYLGESYTIALTHDVVDATTPCDVKISGVVVNAQAQFYGDELMYIIINGAAYKAYRMQSIFAGAVFAAIIIASTIIGTVAAAVAGVSASITAGICASGISIGVAIFLCIAWPSLHKKLMERTYTEPI